MTFHLPDTKFVFVKRLHSFDTLKQDARGKKVEYLTKRNDCEDDLKLLHEIGAIHQVEGSEHEAFLKRELFKRHGVTNAKDIYLAPVKKETGGDSAIHRRAKFITLSNGTVYQFKGIGNNSNLFEDRNNEEVVSTAHGRSTIPFMPSEEHSVFGAYSSDLSNNYFILARQMHQAWRMFVKNSPKTARYLDAPKVPPFALPVENFEYLDVVAKKNNRRGKNKYIRVKSEYEKILTIVKGTVAHKRIQHLASPDATQEEKEAYYRKVATYYKIKNFNSKNEAHREALFRKITNRAIACYAAIWCHSPFTMHKVVDGELKNVLGSKDFNGIEFFDTDDTNNMKHKLTEEAENRDVQTIVEIGFDTMDALNLSHKEDKLHRDFSKRFNNAMELVENEISQAQQE